MKIEPSADLREAANYMRQWFIALTDQGFTEDQALRIISGAIGGVR